MPGLACADKRDACTELAAAVAAISCHTTSTQLPHMMRGGAGFWRATGILGVWGWGMAQTVSFRLPDSISIQTDVDVVGEHHAAEGSLRLA